jgi:hypothetical protein
MIRTFSRFLCAVVLLSTWVIGGVAVSGPAHSLAKSGDFSAASKVLSQTGTVGKVVVPEPPNDQPVHCNYPSVTNQPHIVEVKPPAVYPATGIQTQYVIIETYFVERLPNGGMQGEDAITYTGWATSSTPLQDNIVYAFNGDLGSTYVITVHIRWFNGANTPSGELTLVYTKYQTTFNGSKLAVSDACYPKLPATVSLNSAAYTVGALAQVTYHRMPNTYGYVQGYIDGSSLGGSSLGRLYGMDALGNGSDSFTVPALPMGPHTFKIYRSGRSATTTLTIKPRIKVIPNSALMRGQTVNISLRGFAAHETVNVRWIKNGSFVHIAYVTTSSTGSANINVSVPKWVPDGFTSVRGDGTYGHAQTNVVSVSGGPFSSASVKPASTATPKPSETATPSPSPATVPETATPQLTATVQPTEPVVTETAIPTEAPATETATAQPTETATPTIDPTEEQASATETPTAEPTVVPTETVSP